VEIDEHLLNSIAENTGGKYFRADSSESLEYIYKEINQLEKTKIKGKKNYEYTEFFRVFLWHKSRSSQSIQDGICGTLRT